MTLQMVDFRYNMDIYDTNMNPIRENHYGHKLLIYYAIITLQKPGSYVMEIYKCW